MRAPSAENVYSSAHTSGFGPSPGPITPCVFYSCATSHFIIGPSHILVQNNYPSAETITVGNGNSIPVVHSGKGLLPTPCPSLNPTKILDVHLISHKSQSSSYS